MRINAGHPFVGNVTSKAAIIIGMGRARQPERLFRRIGREEFLAGDAQTLASMPCIDIGRMGLEPRPVALEARVLHSSARQFRHVRHFFTA